MPEGPTVTETELRECLASLDDVDCDYLVASGSLPPGVPTAFYATLADAASVKGTRLVLDTSGEALREALARGVFLVKPSLGELEFLMGRKLSEPPAQEEAAQELVKSGAAQLVAVTLGRDGALLATEAGMHRLKPPDVEAKSAVGAGDSFVGAMTLGLALGRPPEAAFAYGVAAGTAAVLHIGTELCKRADVERLYGEIEQGPIISQP